MLQNDLRCCKCGRVVADLLAEGLTVKLRRKPGKPPDETDDIGHEPSVVALCELCEGGKTEKPFSPWSDYYGCYAKGSGQNPDGRGDEGAEVERKRHLEGA